MSLSSPAARLRNMLVNRVGKKIVAVGRNYKEHAAEMGDFSKQEAPLIFIKPTTSYVTAPGPILIPKYMKCHYEVELGVVISKTVTDVDPELAMDSVAGYLCAIDVTARNVQQVAKDKGLPWTVSKGCDTFTPISDLIPKSKVPDEQILFGQGLELYLKVNGEEKQRDFTSNMIWPIPQLISYISSVITLQEGDVILTGTPKGVGYFKPGDTLEAGITNIVNMSFRAEQKPESRWDHTRSSLASS